MNPVRAALMAAAIAGLAACAGKPGPEAYDALERHLVAQGGLRLDRAPADAPFDNAVLARDFERIALRREADVNLPGGDDNVAPGRLRRWSDPVRWRLAGEAATAEDAAEIAALFDRIAAATGHDVATAKDADPGNFLILITTPEERPAAARSLRELSPPLADTFDIWRQSSSVVCAGVLASGAPGASEISVAFVFIGAEVRGRLRRACIEEEIAQAMGLPNDHPQARPSIFNDDQEFALLTEHDEWLLRVLYDPALRPGMTAEEAFPLVRSILAKRRPERRA